MFWIQIFWILIYSTGIVYAIQVNKRTLYGFLKYLTNFYLFFIFDIISPSACTKTLTKSEAETGHLDWQHFPTALERVLTRCNLRVNLESCLSKCLAAAPERLLANAGSLTFTRTDFGESFWPRRTTWPICEGGKRNAYVASNCRGANAAAPTATMALGWSNSGESCHLRKTTHTRLIFRSNWRLQSRHYRELAIRIGRLLWNAPLKL